MRIGGAEVYQTALSCHLRQSHNLLCLLLNQKHGIINLFQADPRLTIITDGKNDGKDRNR